MVNIKDFITLLDDDVIYFITRNIVYFSKGNKKEDKEQLHNDILTDLELVGLKDRVENRILFTKTIIDDFKDEAEGIIPLQEMIEDLELQKEAFEQRLIWDR
ncbi:hypothetical protein [Alkaliphilus transvaalensis]|uniref:hypothetical protein n=1 Tax=Alkaliphilus transvaalensis TaxID=114628 RepID=UPI00047A7AB4|nr:hypothetical protein [Alkaliphilus transvaalensis]